MAKQQSTAPTALVPSTPHSPTQGRIVLVKTKDKINGQNVHTGLITQVFTHGMINVRVFPGVGDDFTVGSIFPEGHEHAGSTTWHWPPRY